MDQKKKNKWVTGLISALGGPIGAKFAGGLGALQRGSEIAGMSTEEWGKEKGMPKYETPKAYEDYRDLLGLRTRQEMPGYSDMKGEIEQGTAAGLGQLGQLGSGSDTMAGLLGMMGNRQSALRQLGIAASQYQDKARMDYANAVGQGAQYEDKAYEYNQWMPWQMKMNEQMGLGNTGRQIMSDAVDSAMSFGIQGANMAATNQWMAPPQPAMPTAQSYNPSFVSQGMQNRPMYAPPGGTYDQGPSFIPPPSGTPTYTPYSPPGGTYDPMITW